MGFGRIFSRRAGLGRTARLYVAYKFWGNLYFTYPIFYEYASHSLNPVQIGLLFSAIGVFGFLFGIPSGIMADRWSRKQSALIGATFLAGYLVWCCLNATSSFIRVMIQDHIPGSHRATVLSSFKSLAVLVGMVGSTATGWLVQAAHIPRAAYMLFSGLTAVVVIPCAVWLVVNGVRQRAGLTVLYTFSQR